jgi:hypothetical protein
MDVLEKCDKQRGLCNVCGARLRVIGVFDMKAGIFGTEVSFLDERAIS